MQFYLALPRISRKDYAAIVVAVVKTRFGSVYELTLIDNSTSIGYKSSWLVRLAYPDATKQFAHQLVVSSLCHLFERIQGKQYGYIGKPWIIMIKD